MHACMYILYQCMSPDSPLLKLIYAGPVPHPSEPDMQTSPLPATQEDCGRQSPTKTPIEAWPSDSDQATNTAKRGNRDSTQRKRWKSSCCLC